jgi:hypothetical protein
MTAEQETAAVRALARLIATWMENHPATPKQSTAVASDTRTA